MFQFEHISRHCTYLVSILDICRTIFNNITVITDLNQLHPGHYKGLQYMYYNAGPSL